MKVTRIYTGDDDQSHFEDLDIPLKESPAGPMSGPIGAESVIFREAQAGFNMDFHQAPRRQFVMHFAGRVEIECGDGAKRQFGAGEILLADDTTGQGHISREIEGPRFMAFVPLSADVDVDRWR